MAVKLHTRKSLSELFRPTGPKYITTMALGANGLGSGFGSSPTVIQAVDLSLPIRGFRFVIKGRIAIGTANYTSVNPENILNLVSNMLITAINRRQNGNVTLVNDSLASLFGFSNLTQKRAGEVRVNGVLSVHPSIPYTLAASVNGTGLVPLTTAGSPYDFIIKFELPLAPFDISGRNPYAELGFVARQEEYKNTFVIKLTTPTIADNATNALGVSAATTTTTFSSFGSGSGTVTCDIYSLPILLGENKSDIIPGVLSRSSQPINTSLLTSTGVNVELARLQLQPTSRIYIKQGTGTQFPVYASLLDTMITSIGHQIGTDRNVRDTVDIEVHRQEIVEHYDVDPIQGHLAFDFLHSGNTDSAYPGDKVGDVVMRILAGVTGTANGQAHILQEQILQRPEGALVG